MLYLLRRDSLGKNLIFPFHYLLRRSGKGPVSSRYFEGRSVTKSSGVWFDLAELVLSFPDSDDDEMQRIFWQSNDRSYDPSSKWVLTVFGH